MSRPLRLCPRAWRDRHGSELVPARLGIDAALIRRPASVAA